MFRQARSLLVLLLLACGAGLLVFGIDPPDGGRQADSRSFLAACEGGPFAAANTTNSADAARLCACVLSWHLKEGARAGYPLPVALYRSAGTTTQAAATQTTAVAEADRTAREACLSGRMPRTGR